MCVNYRPTSAEILEAMTGLSPAGLPPWKAEVWQDYAAPIVRAGEADKPHLVLATYGMVPKAKAPPGVAMSTMNARAETIGQKRSFAAAWRNTQTCLVPTEWFYEPNWETGRAQRWAIGMADSEPFYVAGIWRAWDDGKGGETYSFTQITVNADEHAVMKHFHKPGSEKRSLVIIPRDEADAWLQVDDPERARSMLALYPAELMKAWPAEKDYGRK